MFRSLLSACSIVVLVLPTLFFSNTSRACPVKLPETLLSLYRNSDAIFIARYEREDDAEIVEDSAEQTILNIRRHFDVSSTLKGEPRKLFVLEEREHRYKPAPSEAPSEASAEDESGEEEDVSAEEKQEDEEADALYRRPNLKPGDTVLLFLKDQHDPDGTITLGLTDYRDAIKKMSGERLDAYEARIRELNSIFGGKKKADDAEIVDWLVRTTQDPLTRWEGAFELQQSYQVMTWQEAQKKQEAEEEEAASDEDEREQAAESGETENSEEAEASDEGEGESDVEIEEFDNAVYARLLTETQKQTLMNVVLESASNRSDTSAGKKKSMSEADKVLLELVSNWGDSRLAKLLLEKMQAASEDPYVIYELMITTINVLDDEELEKITQKYGNLYYEDGESYVDDDDAKEVAEAVDEPEVTNDDETAAEQNATGPEKTANDDVEAPEQAQDAGEQKAHRVTYGELRATLLLKFVTRSVTAIANAEAKEVAKAGQ